MEHPACILTIAGSDSGGGAGIQADLKTISMLGGYGASVITALTAQNTAAVTGIHAPDASFVALQLKTVLEDIPMQAAKTGMLFSASIIEAVAAMLRTKRFPLVVDPVCVAQSGGKLLEDSAVQAMVENMFPLADLLTPNIPEAELFTGLRIDSAENAHKAGRRLLEMGPRAVLIKGGHSSSVAITDWLYLPDQRPLPLMQARVATSNNHGTGCTLSAAIATSLGQGHDTVSAIRRAQSYLNLALRSSYSLGQGSGPPNHLAPLLKLEEREMALSSLEAAVAHICALDNLPELLPEGGAAVAATLTHADDVEEVASVAGGLLARGKGPVQWCGNVGFGYPGEAVRVALQAGRALGVAVEVLQIRELLHGEGLARTAGLSYLVVPDGVSGTERSILDAELSASERQGLIVSTEQTAFLVVPGRGQLAEIAARVLDLLEQVPRGLS